MNNNMIPENFEEFLYWVKERTESYWSKKVDYYEVVPFNESFFNAKWIGLKEEEIDEIELKYKIKFNPHHRSFLKILHTLDRKIVYDNQEPKEFFDNWLNPDNEFNFYLEYPLKSIADSLIRQDDYWIETWGEKPKSKDEQKKVIESKFKDSPKLISFDGYVFTLDGNDYFSEQVLSIVGLDVVYFKSIKQCLLRQLSRDLGIDKVEIDEEDNEWYCDTVLDEYKDECYFDYLETEIEIPFWKDVIKRFNQV